MGGAKTQRVRRRTEDARLIGRLVGEFGGLGLRRPELAEGFDIRRQFIAREHHGEIALKWRKQGGDIGQEQPLAAVRPDRVIQSRADIVGDDGAVRRKLEEAVIRPGAQSSIRHQCRARRQHAVVGHDVGRAPGNQNLTEDGIEILAKLPARGVVRHVGLDHAGAIRVLESQGDVAAAIGRIGAPGQ